MIAQSAVTSSTSKKKVRNQKPSIITDLRLVSTPESCRKEALKSKDEFLEKKLELSEDMIGRWFMAHEACWLLSHYFIQEVKARQNNIGTLDESEWNDDPDGCTPEQYGLKMAKAWREDFFKSGLPFENQWIYIFYERAGGREMNSIDKLLKYYIEMEITAGKVKDNWRLQTIEYEYV